MYSGIWKVWLLAGILFLFSGVMHLIDKEYFLGLIYTFLGLTYIRLSITTYKNNKNSNQIEVSDTVMAGVDIRLRDLISKGKEREAVKYCRMVTRIDLKKAKEYVDLLSKENLK